MALVSRIAAAVGLGAGGLATVAVLPSGLWSTAIVAMGLVVLSIGRMGTHPQRVTAGGVGMISGVVLAALLGLADALVLVATLATVIAWDATENAVTLRAQLGRSADTRRAELAHVGATTAAGGAIGALALVTAILARGRLPALAAVVLVGGTILLGIGLAPFGDARGE